MTVDQPMDEDVKVAEVEDVSKTEVSSSTVSPSEMITGIVSLLEKCVKMKETRLLMGRLMRQTAVVRKHLTQELLAAFLRTSLPAQSESRGFLDSKLQGDAIMAVDGATPPVDVISLLPEVELFAYLLVTLFLVDKKDVEQAKEVSSKAVERLSVYNRRTLDVIAARIYFYYSFTHESTGKLDTIRSMLLSLHRTSVLRHDAIGQETLLNLLLRNYLHYSLYDQAEKFRSKAQKSDQWRSNQQYSRYLYYLGRIRTVQLEYTDARECLMQASRKAPTVAYGFRITVTKWLIVVRLLLGEIPDRQTFSQPGMAKALLPYFQLAHAVRNGDLPAFSTAATQHEAVFRADRCSGLITRLHHNVIRTGLRRINLAYSRISLADVAAKLGLAGVEDAECIVAKAIRDGGIDATIDHEGSFMQSKEVVDIYSTAEPQNAFHARIAFCLDLHNEAIKALRFEPDAHRRKLETAEARKERLAQEQELTQAMAEDDGEDF